MSNKVSSAPNPSYRVLLCILLAALVLRLGWWLYAAPVVSQDGAEYLCAARNLVRGHGYVGCYEGPELMYAPLYPVLIAAFSIVFRNLETGAHLVSLLFGIFLIVPVFLTAWLIYGKRVAYISAVLTALYPVSSSWPAPPFTEAPYVTLFMSGIYCGLRALESRSAKYCLLTGTCFALAYLGRPEAFAYPAFFAIAICIVAALTRKPLHTPPLGLPLISSVPSCYSLCLTSLFSLRIPDNFAWKGNGISTTPSAKTNPGRYGLHQSRLRRRRRNQ